MKEWKKIKTVVAFAALACMLFITACGTTQKADNNNPTAPASTAAQTPKTDAPKTEPQKTQETASAPAGKPQISVTPPEGWKTVEGSVALVQYMKGTCSFIGSYDVMPSDAKTPDAYTSFTKELLGKTFDGAVFQDPKAVTIDGAEGRMLAFTCKVSSMEMEYKIYYAFKNGSAYAFTCGGLKDEFEKLSGDYDAFIASAKLN